MNLNDRNTRVSICVGSEIFVRGLCALLNEANAPQVSIEVISPPQNGNAIDLDCDILILDTELAPTILPQVFALTAHPRIILVSEQRYVDQKMANVWGLACGFFSFRTSEHHLIKHLQTLLECTLNRTCQKTCNACSVFATRRPPKLALSRRESEVFRLIGELHSISEIAEMLNISIKTAESHYANIKQKLGLASSRVLIKAAIDWVEGRFPATAFSPD